MKRKHTLYKIVFLDKESNQHVEYNPIKGKDLDGYCKSIKENGGRKIRFCKQTKYIDGLKNIIFENDVALFKTGNTNCGIDSCALVIFLKNNEIYKYEKGWGNKGVKLSLDHNSLPFHEIIVIGNLSLLKDDLKSL